MKSDIEIARETQLKPIEEISHQLGIDEKHLENYGKNIAKINLDALRPDAIKKNNLILVTAITPTKKGIGKTTVSIGLALGLNKIGKKATVALREPSLGPCFGMKGGAAGGGYAQVLPMEKINLHFTGDFHAITSAHNMISALLDNYIYQNQGDSNKSLAQITWKRVLDVNDRSLRNVVTGLGKRTDGIPSQSGFDITPASEIMAILCLATDLEDLRRRIENIILGYKYDGTAFTVKELGIAGSITVLLQEAIKPNLVQTTENTPAFIHGGPFANIAHGCNSIIATKMAMSYSDYTITEAGFGADLGAEKFYDIKCRKAGLSPKVTILVATLAALKMHGEVSLEEIDKPNKEGIEKGLHNLKRHIENLKMFGQEIIVCFNKFASDTNEEIELVRNYCKEELKVEFAINNAFVQGGDGAVELAQLVVDSIENKPYKELDFIYNLNQTIEDKVQTIASKIYRSGKVNFSPSAKKSLKKIKELGLDHFPVCIAKTQYSFSTNAKAYGDISGFEMEVADVVVNSGAEMIVVIMGNIMRMPGLPKEPQALHIDIIDGNIEGLS